MLMEEFSKEKSKRYMQNLNYQFTNLTRVLRMKLTDSKHKIRLYLRRNPLKHRNQDVLRLFFNVIKTCPYTIWCLFPTSPTTTRWWWTIHFKRSQMIILDVYYEICSYLLLKRFILFVLLSILLDSHSEYYN